MRKKKITIPSPKVKPRKKVPPPGFAFKSKKKYSRKKKEEFDT